MAKVLVTGAAGFIGFHLAQAFVARGKEVVGLDNVNDYYEVALKRARLRELDPLSGYSFVQADICDHERIDALFREHAFDAVVNMAAHAGVRHSLSDPRAYVHSNVDGFLNLLEACRHNAIPHLVYASSSSVYGAATTLPFSIHHNVDHPLSVYAATKKADELLAHCYSHLFDLPATGLRFFTVYGPWGRPDMAIFLFTRAILAGEPIKVFNNGNMQRDFTYIDDIVEAVVRLTERPAAPNPTWSGGKPDPGSSTAPWRLYNIGNNNPVELMYLIEVLERCLGRKAIKEFLPMQPGDIQATCADIDDLAGAVDFTPRTSIEDGVERFVRWYRDYYRS